jgi:hypothetical protein
MTAMLFWFWFIFQISQVLSQNLGKKTFSIKFKIFKLGIC